MLWQSLRSAIRQLYKGRGYALAVIVTLALGIGVNTAVFSMVDGFLLRKLPYPEPEQMGALITHRQGMNPRTNSFSEEDDDSHDLTDWRAVTENVPALIAATSSGGVSGVNLAVGHSAWYVQSTRVSARYFDVLGIRPLLGRSFTSEEDSVGGPQAVIMSYGLWQSSFHSDPNILGKAIDLKGQP